MRIETRNLADLTPHERNYRKHSDAQVAVIAESLRVHGQVKSVVVNSQNVILCGHGLVLAAKSLGWEQVEVTIYDGPNELALLAIDNRASDMAEDDNAALADLLKELEAQGELSAAGYEVDDLQELIDAVEAEARRNNPVEEGELPEVSEGEALVKAGQVWCLGPKHRIMCGDSGDEGDVAALLAGQPLNLIVTSPPYAMQRKEQYGGVPADEYVDWFVPMAALWRKHLTEDGSFFLNIKEHCEDGERSLYVKWLVIALRGDGWKFVDELCWKHPGMPGTYGSRFKNEFEPCFHFARVTDPKFRPEAVRHESAYAEEQLRRIHDPTPGDRKYSKGYTSGAGTGSGNMSHMTDETSLLARPGNVIELHTAQHREAHPACFPIGLPTFFLNAYTDPGDTVFDPFLGSGTTLIAAEQTGRVAYGCEVLPRYCDVILNRWANLTQQDPVCETTGKTWSQVKGERDG